jgi:hypothetical protein
MDTQRKPKHIEVVLARQGDSDTHYVVVASDLTSLVEARKKAKQLATDKPGTVYVPARFWPGLKAQTKTTVEFVDPDECEGQQPGKAGKEDN